MKRSNSQKNVYDSNYSHLFSLIMATSQEMIPDIKKAKIDIESNDGDLENTENKENQGSLVKAGGIPKYDITQARKIIESKAQSPPDEEAKPSSSKTKTKPLSSSKTTKVKTPKSEATKVSGKAKAVGGKSKPASAGKQKSSAAAAKAEPPKRKRCMPKTVDKLLTKMDLDPKKVRTSYKSYIVLVCAFLLCFCVCVCMCVWCVCV